jgi:hypothetical protein
MLECVIFGRVATIMILAVFFKARLNLGDIFCGVAATEFILVYSIVANATHICVLRSVQ